MVTNIVYPGTWNVQLSTNQTPTEKTPVTAKLIEPFVWEFASDTDIPSAEIGNEQTTFVSFEVYNPSGKVAYSFYKEGTEIEDAVDITTELAVYPGE